ncbi:MAG: phage tail tube protein, partial [Actinomycetota bacterium]|nr:phage tail tube protein [Actinomycetota bacterium]
AGFEPPAWGIPVAGTIASGLGSQFGIAKEVTYGTVVTPSRFTDFDSETFKDDPTYQDSVGLRANRFVNPSNTTVRTTTQAPGSVTFDFVTKGMGRFLDLLHATTVAPVQIGATTAYKQNHPVGSSLVDKSATVQFNKPDSAATDRPFTYAGCIVVSFQFSIDTGGKLKLALTFDGREEKTDVALAAASYAANALAFNHIDALAATLEGTPLGAVRGFTLGGSFAMKTDRHFLGSGALKKKPIPNGFFDLNGTLDMEWDGLTAHNYFKSGAKATLILPFEGAVIEGANKEAFKATAAEVQIRGESPSVGGPDVLDQSVPFKILDDGSNVPLDLEYVSTDTAL